MKIFRKKFENYENVTVTNGAGMELDLCTLGASIRDIKVPDKAGKAVSVVLCPEDEEIFKEKYYGKTVGRTAGRIAGAKFAIGNKTAVLEKNNHGEDNLHGGKDGFHSKVFSLATEYGSGYADLKFTYTSPDGEGGYFGTVTLKVTYRVFEKENTFRIIFDGASPDTALLNVTNHVFLNVNGDLSASGKDMKLYINASRVGKLNERLIIEEIIPVSKEMDFTTPHAIGDCVYSDEAQRYTFGYDHPYFLDECGMDKKACSLRSGKSGITLEMSTTYPCVVFYANSCPIDGMKLAGGKSDEQYLSACLECQFHPDGIHACPSNCGIVSPDKPYHEEIEYRFSAK